MINPTEQEFAVLQTNGIIPFLKTVFERKKLAARTALLSIDPNDAVGVARLQAEHTFYEKDATPLLDQILFRQAQPPAPGSSTR